MENNKLSNLTSNKLIATQELDKVAPGFVIKKMILIKRVKRFQMLLSKFKLFSFLSVTVCQFPQLDLMKYIGFSKYLHIFNYLLL